MRRNFYKAAIGCLILFIALSIADTAATERVVAIADIHGDLDAFVGILQRAQLIDPGKHWAGGRAILVQIGDLLDRGPKVRDVMDLLMSLQREAQRQGGRVVVLMGNHEAMNLFRDLRYVSNEDTARFASGRSFARN